MWYKLLKCSVLSGKHSLFGTSHLDHLIFNSKQPCNIIHSSFPTSPRTTDLYIYPLSMVNKFTSLCKYAEQCLNAYLQRKYCFREHEGCVIPCSLSSVSKISSMDVNSQSQFSSVKIGEGSDSHKNYICSTATICNSICKILIKFIWHDFSSIISSWCLLLRGLLQLYTRLLLSLIFIPLLSKRLS